MKEKPQLYWNKNFALTCVICIPTALQRLHLNCKYTAAAVALAIGFTWLVSLYWQHQKLGLWAPSLIRAPTSTCTTSKESLIMQILHMCMKRIAGTNNITSQVIDSKCQFGNSDNLKINDFNHWTLFRPRAVVRTQAWVFWVRMACYIVQISVLSVDPESGLMRVGYFDTFGSLSHSAMNLISNSDCECRAAPGCSGFFGLLWAELRPTKHSENLYQGSVPIWPKGVHKFQIWNQVRRSSPQSRVRGPH